MSSYDLRDEYELADALVPGQLDGWGSDLGNDKDLRICRERVADLIRFVRAECAQVCAEDARGAIHNMLRIDPSWVADPDYVYEQVMICSRNQDEAGAFAVQREFWERAIAQSKEEE